MRPCATASWQTSWVSKLQRPVCRRRRAQLYRKSLAGCPNALFSDPLPAGPAPFESIHNLQQVVIPGSPTLPARVYVVEISATISRTNSFQQFEGQPFALVFAGSGQEWLLYLPPTGPLPF
jgi:hypothetical protein